MVCITILSNMIDSPRLRLLLLRDGREKLSCMFACVAFLTFVVFLLPASIIKEASVDMSVKTTIGVTLIFAGLMKQALHSSRAAALNIHAEKANRDDRADEKATIESALVSVTPTSSACPRPSFSKPTRETRARQLQSQVNEFCTLCFDDVEAPEQSGLTCRMLSIMNMLSTTTSFWCGEERLEEEAFQVLSLSDIDMRAIRCVASAAATMVDGHQWRNAYDLLCSLRPWFSASGDSSLELQRGRLRAGILALGLSQDQGDDFKMKKEKNTGRKVPSVRTTHSARVPTNVVCQQGGCTRFVAGGAGKRGRHSRQKK